MNIRKAFFGFVFAGVAVVSASAQNLVNNGSFETGDFTGWTLVGDPDNTFVETSFSSEGDFSAWLGEIGGHGTLSQSIATVAGTHYTVSFDFAGDGDDPSFFSADFAGSSLLSLNNPEFDVNYLTYTYDVVATSSTSNLVFAFQDDVYFINLDNVSVTANPVPEPASMAVLGLGALGLIRRRRNKKA